MTFEITVWRWCAFFLKFYAYFAQGLSVCSRVFAVGLGTTGPGQFKQMRKGAGREKEGRRRRETIG